LEISYQSQVNDRETSKHAYFQRKIKKTTIFKILAEGKALRQNLEISHSIRQRIA
jgi:hypothetical protein